MFSFLKKFELFLSRLKRNKGLWFTTLSIISVSGIVISMFFISTMTSDTERNIFGKEAKDIKTFYGNVLMTRFNEMYTFGYVLANDKRIINALKQNRLTAAREIATEIQESANMFRETDKRFIKIYKTETVELERDDVVRLSAMQMQDVSGLSVDSEGVFLKSMIPIIENGNVLGTVEVKQAYHTIVREFINSGKEFAFLLNNDMLSMHSLEVRTNNYKKLDDEHSVVEAVYTNKFYTNILFHKKDKIFENEYLKDDDFFTVPYKVYDALGKEIGLAIFGESAAKLDGFVQTTKSLINSVTTVALALVISMILFMF